MHVETGEQSHSTNNEDNANTQQSTIDPLNFHLHHILTRTVIPQPIPLQLIFDILPKSILYETEAVAFIFLRFRTDSSLLRICCEAAAMCGCWLGG